MFDFLKKYILTGYLKFEEDKIRFGSDNLVFYYVPHLSWEYYLNTQKSGLDYHISQYLAAKVRGYTILKDYYVKFKLANNLPSAVELSMDVLKNFGFGTFSSKKVDNNTGFMYIIVKSTLAGDIKRLFGPQDNPVDFMLAGLFAGAADYHMKDKQIYGIEFNCLAQKEKDLCEFITGTKEGILQFTEKFAPQKEGYVKELIEKIDLQEKNIFPEGIEKWTYKRG